MTEVRIYGADEKTPLQTLKEAVGQLTQEHAWLWEQYSTKRDRVEALEGQLEAVTQERNALQLELTTLRENLKRIVA